MHARTQRHYAELLGPVYAWSLGGADAACAAGKRWLSDRGLLQPVRVLDLGAGFGAHSVPLARAGARVTTVDSDSALLDALAATAGDARARITCAAADLVEFLATSDGAWDTALCLGDTLPHLSSLDAVDTALTALGRVVVPGGRLALSWRDASGPGPEDLDRFIEVARDAQRTMHCFVEILDADRVRVTDLVTEVGPDGPRTRFGSYLKLRLPAERVRTAAEAAGFVLDDASVAAGMTEQLWTRRGAV